MRLFRSVLFWLHLAAGILCGAIIFIMSFTGAVLAFEHEIVAWAERDFRRVAAPPNEASGRAAAALPIYDLISRARDAAHATAPEAESAPRVTGVTVSADPRAAVAVNLGRDFGVYYVNPYTGEARAPAATRTHDFMHLMEDWHRRLAASGEYRETGRAITGVSNAAFLFLALSGLWLWWPRQWAARFVRPALWFNGAKGRARDWNWHNVYGFWFLPVLIVLTATGLVISYRWASDLTYRVVGESPPVGAGPAAAPAADFKIERPEGGKKLDYAAVLARIQETTTEWTEITLREGLPQRRGAPPGPDSASSAEGGRRAPRVPEPYSATQKTDDGSPAFAATQLVIHPYTGETLSRVGYDDQTPGRKLRTWLRHLHTGQALGWPGQLVAGLACIAGCILVYTGFALSWRRFCALRGVERPKKTALMTH
jgi:uncharacterized iron-regulated membrane protein